MSVLSSACIFAIEKNTIHSIDIEVFRCNNTKNLLLYEKTEQDYYSSDKVKKTILPDEPISLKGKLLRLVDVYKAISSINLKTYLCLSYWAGSVSALPKPRYSSLANVILYG